MTVFQKPNKPLVIAIGAFLVFGFAPAPVQNGGLVVFAMALTIWGWEEIKDGDGVFRKTLGYAAFGALAVLLFIILNRL